MFKMSLARVLELWESAPLVTCVGYEIRVERTVAHQNSWPNMGTLERFHRFHGENHLLCLYNCPISIWGIESPCVW